MTSVEQLGSGANCLTPDYVIMDPTGQKMGVR